MSKNKTRNAGTWTEAQYWAFLRSKLRQAFRYWKPIQRARDAARRPYRGPNKRQKWEYQCNHCNQWFKGSEVQVDHIIPCGPLRCVEDLPRFLENLTTETGFQVLCKSCHKDKTKEERESE